MCIPTGPVSCTPGDGICEGGQSCNPGTGACEDAPDAAFSTTCEIDVDACTLEHCDGLGSCVFLSPVDCDDGEFCTLDDCDSATGCFTTPNPDPICQDVGGELIPIETTSVLLGATQTAASWMIPIIVSAAGIAIVIARKFSKYQPI